MKRLLYPLLALMFISTTANANIYDDCETAVSANNLNEVKKLAATIQRLNTIANSNLIAARLCVSTALGEPMVFMAATQSFITLVEFKALQAKKELSEAKKRAERLKLGAKKKAERLKLEAMKEKIVKLEKQVDCIMAKSSEITIALDSIDKRFEKTNRMVNQSLILNDTHKACSELYSSDQSAAMLNQSCIDAFQSMGHPKFVLAESEQKSVYSNELTELAGLKVNLMANLLSTQIELGEAEGIFTEQELYQKLADDLEVKSCAEFGYEGVYLD